jgi:L-lactate dehydrogenase (cytochrome)
VDTSRFINISDLRVAAKRRLPQSVFDYIDGGADGEITLRENVRAFEDVVFLPHCAVDAPPVDRRTTLLGPTISMSTGH